MSRVIERRKIKLPPLKINKDLIETIGSFLEREDMNTKYAIKSDLRDINSGRITDFIESEWPNKINDIVLEAQVPEDREYSRIRMEIRLNSSYGYSSIIITGQDGIWVNGISTSLNNIVEVSKLNHHWFVKSIILRSLATMFLSISLLYGLMSFLKFPFISENTPPLLSLFIFLSIAMYELLNRLFPCYEYGETLSLKIRKYLIALITFSGIIPWVIDKMLNYFM